MDPSYKLGSRQCKGIDTLPLSLWREHTDTTLNFSVVIHFEGRVPDLKSSINYVKSEEREEKVLNSTFVIENHGN